MHFGKKFLANEANLLKLLWKSVSLLAVAKRQIHVRVFSTGNLVLARMNPKPAPLKNFVFDWKPRFRLCSVYYFQNLLGLELPI